MLERFAAFTFRAVEPLTAPRIALITVFPRFLAVARPAAVIEATVLFEELHATLSEISLVVPSEKVPVAVNCCMMPSGIDVAVGVTRIEVNIDVEAETSRVAVPEIPPEVAVMVDVPAATACANPALLIVATEAFDDAHVADLVRSLLLPSL
jgi:hypothetical protein